MKIVVLNSSPRANGNTAAMVEQFKKGAEESGHEVTVIPVAKKKIAGCMACGYCHTKGEGQCIQKDDMQEIYPVLKESDAIVLASPIYYFAMDAQIQCAINRFYAPGKFPNITKSAMILSSGSPNVYTAAEAQYHDMRGWLGWEDRGIVKAAGAENGSAEKLAECFELGKNM